MNQSKAEEVLRIAAQVLKLQEDFKNLTGAIFNVSQNLVDSVNYAQGFLAALRQQQQEAKKETPKLEEVK